MVRYLRWYRNEPCTILTLVQGLNEALNIARVLSQFPQVRTLWHVSLTADHVTHLSCRNVSAPIATTPTRRCEWPARRCCRDSRTNSTSPCPVSHSNNQISSRTIGLYRTPTRVLNTFANDVNQRCKLKALRRSYSRKKVAAVNSTSTRTARTSIARRIRNSKLNCRLVLKYRFKPLQSAVNIRTNQRAVRIEQSYLMLSVLGPSSPRRANHLKNCAIRSLIHDGKVMATLADTHRVETLLAINGKMLADEKYLQTLVEISNLKLVAARKRFDAVTLCLEQRLH